MAVRLFMLTNQKFLIVLDCDGTLLTDEKTIMPKTAAYLKKLLSLGHIVTMASGRPGRAVLPYYREIGCHGPFIGYNGALIVDPDDPTFPVFKKRFPKKVIQDFMDHFSESDFLNIMAEDDKNLYFLRPEDDYENYFHPENMIVHYGWMRDTIKDDLCSFIISLREPEKTAAKVRSILNNYDDITFRAWSADEQIGEFCFYDVNKSTAIEVLEKYYHIDRAHVIAFGDANNDIEMIKKAGVSFAMKNGDENIKQSADYITPEDNNHEGIYLALKQFLQDDED